MLAVVVELPELEVTALGQGEAEAADRGHPDRVDGQKIAQPSCA